jgi:hypothetical protein
MLTTPAGDGRSVCSTPPRSVELPLFSATIGPGRGL